MANVYRGSNASTGSSINSRNSVSRGLTLRQTSESGNSSKTSSAAPTVGGAVLNVDQVTNELGDFSTRVSNVLDIITTLSQFGQLSLHGKLEGLPRVGGIWELSVMTDEQYSTGSASEGRSVATSKRESPNLLATTGAEDESKSKDGSESDITLDTPDFLEQMIMKQKASSQHAGGHTSRPLSALKEESVVGSLKSASVVSGASGKGALMVGGEGYGIYVGVNIQLHVLSFYHMDLSLDLHVIGRPGLTAACTVCMSILLMKYSVVVQGEIIL